MLLMATVTKKHIMKKLNNSLYLFTKLQTTMKKLLSLMMLLVAIVTGAQAAADRTFALTDFTKDGNNYSCSFSSNELKNKNKVTYVEVPNASASGTISFYGSSDKDRYLYIYKTNGTVKDTDRPILMTGNKTEDGTIDYASTDILTEDGKYYLVFSTTDDFKAKNIDFTVAAASDKPTITDQPVGATYQVGATPAALSVTAEASAGDLAYQWYTCEDAEGTNPEAIATATASTYTPSTESTGTTYYYVVITDDNGSVTSDIVAVNVVTEEAPEVNVTMSSEKPYARTGAEYTLTANITAGVPEPTLQWYSCDDAEGTNAQAIDGATAATYQPSTATVGTFYYLVKASNTAASDVASNVVTLNVIDGGAAGTVDDLVEVSEGYVFVADDVTGDGNVSPAANTIYDDGKIFVSGAFTVATNKGSNTFGGASHYNSMRLKNNTDYIAFKVADACVITFYAENPNKSNRHLKVGETPNNDSYGTIPDGQTTANILIPAAGTVYVTGMGSDRYFGGFEVKSANETITIPAEGVLTYVTENDLDFSSVEGLTAYVPTGVNSTKTSVATAEVTSVPAGTALLIKGDAGEYNVTIVASAEAPESNIFQVSNGSIAGGDNIFAYSKSALKFMKVDASVTIPSGKCYLVIEGVSGDALDLDFDGEATAVEAIAEANANSAAPVKVIKNGKLYIGNYNVAGQQVK